MFLVEVPYVIISSDTVTITNQTVDIGTAEETGTEGGSEEETGTEGGSEEETGTEGGSEEEETGEE